MRKKYPWGKSVLFLEMIDAAAAGVSLYLGENVRRHFGIHCCFFFCLLCRNVISFFDQLLAKVLGKGINFEMSMF